MPSIRSSDIDTVNNLRGSSLPLSLVESVTVMSVSEAGITTTQRDERKPLRKREAASHVTSYAPCSDLHLLPAICLPMRPTEEHYMEGTV